MGSLPSESRLNLKNVAIIGAGPSGLAAAKYLLAEKAFSNITIFEQRSNVGGLWNHVSGENYDLDDCKVPQTNPHADVEKPRWQRRKDGVDEPLFQSAVYDRLEINIPRDLMGFSDLDWPADCQLFPGQETVLAYLERYAADVRHLVRFREQVLDVRTSRDHTWIVKTQSLSPDQNGAIKNQHFDAVVVANGHFNIPFLPVVPGIQAWNKAYPGSIIHSQFYRKPEHYAGKKVIVVGNSASGVDIAAQIARVCQSPLLQSQKSESYFQSGSSSSIVEKPEIVEVVPENGIVRFKNGTEESNVNAIVYCTGYFYSYPFLKCLFPPPVTLGEHVENTYQHIFYRPHPTLAFPVLNQKVIPFPVAEAQSAVIARVWSGRLPLPSEAEMKEWEQRHSEDVERGRDYHVLKFPKDADYINMLHDWAMSADGEIHAKRLSQQQIVGNGSARIGKTPPYWGEKQYWIRERFPAIKKAFNSFGEERHSKRTLEDVGFDFQAWKREQAEDAKRLLKQKHLVSLRLSL